MAANRISNKGILEKMLKIRSMLKNIKRKRNKQIDYIILIGLLGLTSEQG